ncbi:transporter substrate-binding domain-containing protein [Aeromicrobium sp. UC242_57]|uniref:transporter substrate-binding domain-containing protein n=1 Tax=Aeromicrobium sp. UC242_57 TaxID=3374624 RepID=UPI0037918548
MQARRPGPPDRRQADRRDRRPGVRALVQRQRPQQRPGIRERRGLCRGREAGFAKDDVTWVKAGFNQVIQPGKKAFDFDINQFSISEKRARAVDFSSPYYSAAQAIITLKDGKFASATSLADLKDAKPARRSPRPRWRRSSRRSPRRPTRSSTTTRPRPRRPCRTSRSTRSSPICPPRTT